MEHVYVMKCRKGVGTWRWGRTARKVGGRAGGKDVEDGEKVHADNGGNDSKT